MKITNVKVEMFEWKSKPWKTNYRNIFGQTVQLGVVTIETDALAEESCAWEGLLYKPVSDVQHAKGDLFRLKAIPYYSWANRHPQTMRVWIPRSNLTN